MRIRLLLLLVAGIAPKVVSSFVPCPSSSTTRTTRRTTFSQQPTSRLEASPEELSDSHESSPSILLDNFKNNKLSEQRAGKEGYSVLRQPLDAWDPSVDPTFEIQAQQSAQQAMMDSTWWLQKETKASRKEEDRKESSRLPADQAASVDDQAVDATTASLNLVQRTMETLDMPYILEALAKECSTQVGKSIVRQGLQELCHSNICIQPKKTKKKNDVAYQSLSATSVEGVQERYQAVQEMQYLLNDLEQEDEWDEVEDETATSRILQEASYRNRRGIQVSLHGSPPPIQLSYELDLDSIWEMAEIKGQILQGPELLEISDFLHVIENVQLWSERGLQKVHNEDGQPLFVQLPKLVDAMDLNTTLQELLDTALDPKDGKLSGTTFPKLGQLRGQVRTLKQDILQTLNEIVSLPSIQSKLALESGGPLISQVSNGQRLVIPIDSNHASSIGMVHDSSRSGKTAYVEPSEIVGPTNTLRQLELELQQEESRIWKLLSDQVLLNKDSLQQSMQVLGQLDVIVARVQLGKKLQGVIPTVKEEGVLKLREAKHAVLLLRKLPNVIGSDLSLGANGNQGLVLTGPNSGGKSIILKLIGLAALLSKCGIPIPAQPGARVDYFDPILADIGDMQTSLSDLSTFSGHMLVCQKVLEQAQPNSLILLDELGSGTDPKQGVAIAQALLEAIVDVGSRVAITTHYLELKQLAASNDKFSVGGMQFVAGKPTYKLLPGTVGESYAMAVAERLKLPSSVIERATELLDSDTRMMGDLIQQLEEQRDALEQQQLELQKQKDDMEQIQDELEQEKAKLERQMLTARRQEAKKFATQLEEKEQILENILEKLKQDPSRKLITKSWDEIRFVKRDAINEAEQVPSVVQKKKEAQQIAPQELVPLSEMRDKPDLKPGDTVILCKPGPLFGRTADVIQSRGRRIEVKVNGMGMNVKESEVSVTTGVKITPSKRQPSPMQSKSTKRSKAAQKALLNEKSGSSNSSTIVDNNSKNKNTSSSNLRTDSNTVDVRGCTLIEAQDKAKTKFSQCMLSGRNVVFVLHGHGTSGILKTKIRGWLQSESRTGMVKKFGPADAEDGGDAFTRVELR